MAKSSGKPKKDRCWSGYEPVPGKRPYSKGSCKKVSESDLPGPRERFINSGVRNGHEIVVARVGSGAYSPIAVYINEKKIGIFPHKAAALSHILEATKQASLLITEARGISPSCLDCDADGRRDTDDNMDLEYRRKRHAEYMKLHAELWRSREQRARYDVLQDLRKRDNRYDFDEKQRRHLRQHELTEALRLIEERVGTKTFKYFEKLARKRNQKIKELNQAKREGKSGLQGLKADIDKLNSEISKHPVNQISYWRKRPKFVAKLETDSDE